MDRMTVVPTGVGSARALAGCRVDFGVRLEGRDAAGGSCWVADASVAFEPFSTPLAAGLALPGARNGADVTFSLCLGEDQLARLEALRRGGGLRFLLAVRGAALAETGVDALACEVRYAIEAEAWTVLLGEAGRREHVRIEVPLPPARDANGPRPAGECLRAAHSLFLEGRYDEAATGCRRAIQMAHDLAGARRPAVTTGEAPGCTREDAQRMLALAAALVASCER